MLFLFFFFLHFLQPLSPQSKLTSLFTPKKPRLFNPPLLLKEKTLDSDPLLIRHQILTGLEFCMNHGTEYEIKLPYIPELLCVNTVYQNYPARLSHILEAVLNHYSNFVEDSLLECLFSLYQIRLFFKLYGYFKGQPYSLIVRERWIGHYLCFYPYHPDDLEPYFQQFSASTLYHASNFPTLLLIHQTSPNYAWKKMNHLWMSTLFCATPPELEDEEPHLITNKMKQRLNVPGKIKIDFEREELHIDSIKGFITLTESDIDFSSFFSSLLCKSYVTVLIPYQAQLIEEASICKEIVRHLKNPLLENPHPLFEYTDSLENQVTLFFQEINAIQMEHLSENEPRLRSKFKTLYYLLTTPSFRHYLKTHAESLIFGIRQVVISSLINHNRFDKNLTDFITLINLQISWGRFYIHLILLAQSNVGLYDKKETHLINISQLETKLPPLHIPPVTKQSAYATFSLIKKWNPRIENSQPLFLGHLDIFINPFNCFKFNPSFSFNNNIEDISFLNFYLSDLEPYFKKEVFRLQLEEKQVSTIHCLKVLSMRALYPKTSLTLTQA